MYIDNKRKLSKDIAVRLGENISKMRRERGLTQLKLANLLDMEASQVSKIECGAHGMSLNCFIRISLLLGCSTDYLLFGHAIPGNSLIEDRLRKIFLKDPKKFLMIVTIIDGIYSEICGK